MNLAPHPLPSPILSYDQHIKHSFSTQPPCYPTTPQPEPASMERPNRGLGIFDLPLPQQTQPQEQPGPQQQQRQGTIQELPPSPQPSDSWSHSSVMEQGFPQTSQPPDIFSAAFDPFSGYTNNANTGMIASTSPEAPSLVYCQTPPSTNIPSSVQSSISSPYSPSMQTAYYNGTVKQEDSNEWYPAQANGHPVQRPLNTQGMTPYSNGVSPINGSTDGYQAGSWPKPASTFPMDYGSECPRSKFDAAPVLPSVNRVKKKRQRTTPEEATHECRVCGKLFKRSYNWKSHMETHNPERKYPHPCTAMNGNTPCTKKFQRKTDLDRHVDSVHLKARNHRCNLCGNRFARRDTLRRHTEDGCPKRFELGFREGSAVAPVRWSYANLPRNRSYDASAMSQSASSSMAAPMSAAPSSTFPTYSRAEFVSSPIQTASVFAS